LVRLHGNQVFTGTNLLKAKFGTVPHRDCRVPALGNSIQSRFLTKPLRTPRQQLGLGTWIAGAFF